MTHLPSGTVTFLFTDIEGSTALWERDRAAMAAAVDRHLALLNAAIAAHGGIHYKTVGDAVQAAFSTAPAAIAVALEAQRAFHAEAWNTPDPVRVRMALHAGEAQPRDGDYLTAPLNRLSRLLSSGYGGQILLSQAVQQLTRGALPEDVELRDLGEHRLRDLLEPERVYQLLHPNLPADFPPLKSLDNQPNNLPRQPTPFLGREREVREVMNLLRRPDVQLLTLTGPGGTGKTRLALQAAADLVDDFPDGVFLVPLAPLTDPDLVPSAIAAALGMREEGGRLLAERLRDVLATKQLLLVLDNVEHLIEATAAIGTLLSSSPGLTVLVTSRVPLRLRAEREYPVSPLGLPRREPPPSLEQLSQYEAVRLFIERAQAVKPDFAIDNATAPAVAEICHRLDGLPLAIELAAARVRILPPRALLARLEQRLPLLTGGARDAPERQRTLRDTIAWSHDLLSDKEQALFQRLAIFAGGWTLETAEAVTNPDRDLDVFAGLERLVEQNMVRQEEGPEGEPRFAMLETIREFGLEQLENSGKIEAVRRQHLDWCVTIARMPESSVLGGELRRWLARLDVEHANIRAALTWAIERAEIESALLLAGNLWPFWFIRSHLREGMDWLQRVRPLLGRGSQAAQSAVLVGSGAIAGRLGDYSVAVADLQEGLARAQMSGDAVSIGIALLLAGHLESEQGNLDVAQSLLNEAVAIFDRHGLPFWRAHTLHLLGRVAFQRGDLGEAATLMTEALDLQRHLGNDWGIAVVLMSLGLLERRRKDSHRAQAYLSESFALNWMIGAQVDSAQTLEQLAAMQAQEGELNRAARWMAAAAALREKIGVKWLAGSQQIYESEVAFIRSRLGEPKFVAAWTEGQSLPEETAVAEVLDALREAQTHVGTSPRLDTADRGRQRVRE